MSIPLSVHEIIAERDQLRAEFAVERRRIERKFEFLNRLRADEMGQNSRLVLQIGELETEQASLIKSNADQVDTIRTLERTQNESIALTATMAKALHDAGGLYERKQLELIDLYHAYETSKIIADQQHTNNKALEMRLSGLQLRLEEIGRELVRAEMKSHEKTREASSLSEELDLARSEAKLLNSKVESFQKRLENETARGMALEAEIRESGSERQAKSEMLRSLTIKRDIAEQAFRDAKRREEELVEVRDRIANRMHAIERAAAEKIEHQRSENAALQGALETARRECDTLRRANTYPRLGSINAKETLSNDPEREENVVLRKSIEEIAETILQLDKGLGGPKTGDANGTGIPLGMAHSALHVVGNGTAENP
jgi:hypothetical protein